MTKKRILMLNYEFPPLGGGAANATHHLLKEFSSRKDIQVDLITSSTGKYREEQFAENIRIYFLDISKNGNIHYQTNKDLLTYSWKAYKLGKKLGKNNHYDLAHAFFGIPCGYIAMKLGLPYIVSLRGSDVPFYNKRFYWLDKLLFKRMSKKIWEKSKATITNSEGLKELAIKSSPKQDICVIYNGVDIKKFQSQSSHVTCQRLKFTILYVGRLIERKGVKYLIGAFAKLNNQNDCELIIAGTGNLEAELKKQANTLGQSHAIRFLGAVSHDKLPAIYCQSDAYVLPSFNEGMSNTLLEAMASGLPVVATDTGGTRELVRDNGIIIEKGSSKAIYEALKILRFDKERSDNLGKISLKKAGEMGWVKMAERYINLY